MITLNEHFIYVGLQPRLNFKIDIEMTERDTEITKAVKKIQDHIGQCRIDGPNRFFLTLNRHNQGRIAADNQAC